MASPTLDLPKQDNDGAISRREFIQKSALLTGGLTAATTIGDSFGSRKAYAD